MSNLVKPYEISVWEDQFIEGQLREVKILTIGSDKMRSHNRALSPNLTRNINGVKKFSFSMYKKYVDTVTGQEIENPFIGQLFTERKVKLKYGTYIDKNGIKKDRWYDFIIKNISENSSTHLYTYQLEDALVQELSRNGYNITLDAQLMNNTGDATELANYVLQETDWRVADDSEVFVQTIEENLVYLQMPKTLSQTVYHIIDQTAPYNTGVVAEEADFSKLAGKTILAFYSSCTNKPYRFQFIYANEGDYSKNKDGTFQIRRNDRRIIEQSDCQYYIDFDLPEDSYVQGDELSKKYNLFIPKGFTIVEIKEDELENSAISNWYLGNRYGFTQQSVYVPLLERYCQKFKLENKENLSEETISDGIKLTIPNQESTEYIINCSLTSDNEFVGIKIEKTSGNIVSYTLINELSEICAYRSYQSGWDDDNINIQISELGLKSATYKLEIVYIPNTKESSAISIKPQHNNNHNSWTFSDVSLTAVGNYLGYTDAKYNSPSNIRNYITNYNFESTSGWYANSGSVDVDKPEIENVYGRFAKDGSFVSILTDYINNVYEANKTDYQPYLRFSCLKSQQSLLNSCIKDNRTLIGEITKGDKWVLDYKILPKNQYTTNFEFQLAEYQYNTKTGRYEQQNNNIIFKATTPTELESKSTPTGYSRVIFEATESTYNESTFKKNSKIFLSISPPNEGEYYIEKILLYKETFNEQGIIIPDDYVVTEGEAFSLGELQHTYHYFNQFLIDENNGNRITNKDQLITEKSRSLKYDKYKPVYNEGARKIRQISAKESNYFNILQNIAETFGAWLELEVERDESGAIIEKRVRFKNYACQNNYANFRYGVNLKDIQRTHDSKSIVTKLLVKPNNNELADNGFCTIQRAGANPTGENYIYDFQYYHNMGIMDINDYLNTTSKLTGAKGPDYYLWEYQKDGKVVRDVAEGSLEETNLNGYFLRLKKINTALVPISERLAELNTDLVQENSKLEVANATYESAVSGAAQTEEDLLKLTNKSSVTEALQSSNTDAQKYANELLLFYQKIDQSENDKETYQSNVDALKEAITTQEEQYKQLLKIKTKLNNLFFTKYSRFIQEGTWISEEYVDDEKYYADSKSVIYNSCYPQVGYTINVLSLRGVPGYELIDFEIGDKTKAIDPQFFGELQEEVIVTEMSEMLDSPDKNTIKVQNSKNQFQDLFQKITATVQQTQYNYGSYEKGAAFLEATTQKQSQFITNAINAAQEYLKYGQTVTSGSDGITITDSADSTNRLKLVGGAILFSTTDPETQETTWRTGITKDGISADLIQTGQLDTKLIQIMSADGPAFRWDSYGLSAYDVATSKINTKKFVRFDKHGIYGINEYKDVDGETWYPSNMDEIDEKATFALTWQGLKVTHSYNDDDDNTEKTATVRLGKFTDGLGNDCIMRVNNGTTDTLLINNKGNLFINGNVTATEGQIGAFKIRATESYDWNNSTYVTGNLSNILYAHNTSLHTAMEDYDNINYAALVLSSGRKYDMDSDEQYTYYFSRVCDNSIELEYGGKGKGENATLIKNTLKLKPASIRFGAIKPQGGMIIDSTYISYNSQAANPTNNGLRISSESDVYLLSDKTLVLDGYENIVFRTGSDIEITLTEILDRLPKT